MATCEWTDGEARLITYDSDTETVTIDGVSRPATPDEIETGSNLLTALIEEEARRSGTAPEPPAPVLSVRDTLYDALTTMRGVTGDQIVSDAEVGQALTAVVPALESYRDLEVWDEEAIRLTVLLLAQAVQALYILVGQARANAASNAAVLLSFESRLTALESPN